MDKARYVQNFYEIQKKQWKTSLLLFILVFLVYFIFMGFIAGIILFFIFLFFRPALFTDPQFLYIFAGSALAASFLVAAGHYLFARLGGPDAILKSINAQAPDPDDLYHKRFVNMVEELRIAAGMPRVDAYIIDAPGVNSMSLIQKNGRPAIIASEGILGKCNRAELQAALAHELAHIIKGDTHVLTMVCSLGALFNKLCESISSAFTQDHRGGSYRGFNTPVPRGGGGHGGGYVLIALIFAISFIGKTFMHILTTFLSRKREIAADAMAVEITREPLALSLAIYKAHTHYSFMGDFCQSYTPLFIVSPESRGYSLETSFAGRFWDSHPPLKNRLEILAGMSNVHYKDILAEYWKQKEEKAQNPVIKLRSDADEPGSGIEDSADDKGWEILDEHKQWAGPYPLQQLVRLALFTPMVMIRNQEQGILGEAGTISAVKKYIPSWEGESNFRCPVCHMPLQDIFYEGVPIYQCAHGHGKTLTRKQVTRIVMREEIDFCEDLKNTAEEFRKIAGINPQKIKGAKEINTLPCPGCSREMKYRPYNYQYYLMVHECFTCNLVWFEGQLLEILQIIIEKAKVPDSY